MTTTTCQPCLPTNRELVYTFLSLPNLVQDELAKGCDLIEPEDKLMNRVDAYLKWFQRAERRNLLAVFWDKIREASQEAKREIA